MATVQKDAREDVREPQHAIFQADPVARLAELQFRLEPLQQVCSDVADELQQLQKQENAAKELQKLTEDLPEHGYENRRASEILARLADERRVAEDRLTRAKKGVAASGAWLKIG